MVANANIHSGRKMKYIYFIHYDFSGGTGNTVFPASYPISKYDHIRAIEKGIEDKSGLNNVVISNFILLGTEP